MEGFDDDDTLTTTIHEYFNTVWAPYRACTAWYRLPDSRHNGWEPEGRWHAHG